MKQCTRCNEYKPVNEYHIHGKDQYCKICRKLINRSNYLKRKAKIATDGIIGITEKSTLLGMRLLNKEGIPCIPGVMSGLPWSDLIAWGCIPIEIKVSKPLFQYHDVMSYKWKFTDRQQQIGFDGFILFIGVDSEGEADRVFVVPGDVEWLNEAGKLNRTALSVTFNSNDPKARNEQLLIPYENLFELIEYERVNKSKALRNGADLKLYKS